ncbi:MAG: hypothetical protein K2X35_13390 [Bryobacteraceae bacterium]|nr:hypothetical protein [Bryobacteraceae bacterium]
MLRRLLPTLILAAIAGCQRMPEPYAPPAQRQPVEQPRPPRAARVLSMSEAGVEASFVSGIGALEGSWRWTGRTPGVRVYVSKPENLRFVAEFALSEVTFRDTGPVTITFLVNGKAVDRVRYEKPGQQVFEKPVPAGWMPPGEESVVSLELDKAWVSKKDGAELGVILSRLGLQP